jgi:hypothetical protein
LKPHAPDAHVAVPFATPGQTTPQPLQLFGSVCSATQTPLQSV